MSFLLSPPCHVRVNSVPLLPITSEPPSTFGTGSPWNSSSGGTLPPSYHIIFTGGLSPRAGNWNSISHQEGAVSFRIGSPVGGEQSLTSTEVGAVSSRAHHAVSRLWTPMSPIGPVPKSQNPRHLNGT